MPSRGTARAAPVFAALGEPSRLALLQRLSTGGQMSIAQLAEGSSVTRQAVTKHLRVLHRARLVTSTWVGRERRFQLAPHSLDEAQRALGRLSTQWDSALERLRRLVEDS